MEKLPASADNSAMQSRTPAADDVFELTREQLDELPFGVVTLDRQGVVLR
jgi:hypothetical protein